MENKLLKAKLAMISEMNKAIDKLAKDKRTLQSEVDIAEAANMVGKCFRQKLHERPCEYKYVKVLSNTKHFLNIVEIIDKGSYGFSLRRNGCGIASYLLNDEEFYSITPKEFEKVRKATLEMLAGKK